MTAAALLIVLGSALLMQVVGMSIGARRVHRGHVMQLLCE
jgi:hypothetical protein